MSQQPIPTSEMTSQLKDTEIVERVLKGEAGLFEILIRRYNQRLYRVARSIVKDEAEAEDIMQDAYVRAYGKLHQYEGRAEFSTWLTRIAVHEALARRKQRHRLVSLEADEALEAARTEGLAIPARNPEDKAGDRELLAFLSEAVDALPDSHRSVLMLRAVEGMTTAETSFCLGISTENVRVRMHRARSQLRYFLENRLGSSLENLFEFHLPRCDRIVEGTMLRIARSIESH